MTLFYVAYFCFLKASSLPGTIRGDFCIHIGRYVHAAWGDVGICGAIFNVIVHRNICHGSDSVSGAEKEIALWFKPEELVDWTPTEYQWIYE